MTRTTRCPPLSNLELLIQGRLPLPYIDAVAQHVESCPACGLAFENLTSSSDLQEILRRNNAPADGVLARVVLNLMQKRVSDSTPGETAALEHVLSTSPGVTVGPRPATEHYDFLSPPQEPDELGRLGPYRVLEVLGQGGMGVVFKAEDPRLGRICALKTMRPEVARYPEMKERFLREARAAAQLEHDNIIPIFQVDEDRGVPYISMPFLKGMSLESYALQKTVLGVVQTVRIGRAIARGLAVAHAKGMIHRDIKPANVWLDSSASGRVKILDFGLARLTAGEQSLTQAGAIMGTPSYMAPEQARAEIVDGRADLFSLGVVLYRLCTGELPFKGTDTISTLMALATCNPPTPSQLHPSIPVAFSDIVMRLLEKDPARRTPSADVLIHELQVFRDSIRHNEPAPTPLVVPEEPIFLDISTSPPVKAAPPLSTPAPVRTQAPTPAPTPVPTPRPRPSHPPAAPQHVIPQLAKPAQRRAAPSQSSIKNKPRRAARPEAEAEEAERPSAEAMALSMLILVVALVALLASEYVIAKDTVHDLKLFQQLIRLVACGFVGGCIQGLFRPSHVAGSFALGIVLASVGDWLSYQLLKVNLISSMYAGQVGPAEPFLVTLGEGPLGAVLPGMAMAAALLFPLLPVLVFSLARLTAAFKFSLVAGAVMAFLLSVPFHSFIEPVETTSYLLRAGVMWAVTVAGMSILHIGWVRGVCEWSLRGLHRLPDQEKTPAAVQFAVDGSVAASGLALLITSSLSSLGLGGLWALAQWNSPEDVQPLLLGAGQTLAEVSVRVVFFSLLIWPALCGILASVAARAGVTSRALIFLGGIAGLSPTCMTFPFAIWFLVAMAANPVRQRRPTDGPALFQAAASLLGGVVSLLYVFVGCLAVGTSEPTSEMLVVLMLGAMGAMIASIGLLGSVFLLRRKY